MFRWYQNASICYAFLADVRGAKDHEDTINRFIESRWFGRGWTLQELLAPSRLRFYGEDWNYLGDKNTLIKQLEEATKIDFGALKWSWTIPSYSIAARMSWASNRITTRIEDQAYCMLGILGVHMPLLYGEGENAFRRLQEELIKISDDETIFAHSGPKVLASCTEQFSNGGDLVVSRKQFSAPYSITNAGLQIQMRIWEVEMDAQGHDDQAVQVMGIMNCHHSDDKDRRRELALWLEKTESDDTYRKCPYPPHPVDASRIIGIACRTIFIQLQAFKVSKQSLLEQYDLCQYRSRIGAFDTKYVFDESKRELTVYPRPSSEYELVIHIFQRLHDGNLSEVTVVTIFESWSEKAGLLVLPNGLQARDDDEYLYNEWKCLRRPQTHRLSGWFLTDPNKTVTVQVERQEHLNQSVWSLQIFD